MSTTLFEQIQDICGESKNAKVRGPGGTRVFTHSSAVEFFAAVTDTDAVLTENTSRGYHRTAEVSLVIDAVPQTYSIWGTDDAVPDERILRDRHGLRGWDVVRVFGDTVFAEATMPGALLWVDPAVDRRTLLLQTSPSRIRLHDGRWVDFEADGGFVGDMEFPAMETYADHQPGGTPRVTALPVAVPASDWRSSEEIAWVGHRAEDKHVALTPAGRRAASKLWGRLWGVAFIPFLAVMFAFSSFTSDDPSPWFEVVLIIAAAIGVPTALCSGMVRAFDRRHDAIHNRTDVLQINTAGAWQYRRIAPWIRSGHPGVQQAWDQFAAQLVTARQWDTGGDLTDEAWDDVLNESWEGVTEQVRLAQARISPPNADLLLTEAEAEAATDISNAEMVRAAFGKKSERQVGSASTHEIEQQEEAQ